MSLMEELRFEDNLRDGKWGFLLPPTEHGLYAMNRHACYAVGKEVLTLALENGQWLNLQDFWQAAKDLGKSVASGTGSFTSVAMMCGMLEDPAYEAWMPGMSQLARYVPTYKAYPYEYWNRDAFLLSTQSVFEVWEVLANNWPWRKETTRVTTQVLYDMDWVGFNQQTLRFEPTEGHEDRDGFGLESDWPRVSRTLRD